MCTAIQAECAISVYLLTDYDDFMNDSVSLSHKFFNTMKRDERIIKDASLHFYTLPQTHVMDEIRFLLVLWETAFCIDVE